MAVEYLDGFDTYGIIDTPSGLIPFDQSPMRYRWTKFGTPLVITSPIAARRPGGLGIYLNSQGDSVNNHIVRSELANAATRCLGFAWRSRVSFWGIQPIAFFKDGATMQMSLLVDTAGKLRVYRGPQSALLFTSTNALSSGTWYYIEFKVTIHGSTGVFEVRVNGSSTGWVPQQTSQNTQHTANAYTNAAGLSSFHADYFDDFYIADDFQGDSQVVALQPRAAGNSSDWTPTRGDNHTAIRHFADVEDDSVVHTTTAGDVDTHDFDELPINTGAIRAVQHAILARQETGSTRQIRPITRSGGTDYAGTTRNLGTGYQMLIEVLDEDPDTSSAWDIAGVEAAEYGYELVT